MRDDIVQFINDELRLKDYPDYGPMGLQYSGRPQVNKIACAVSASADVIRASYDRGADFLVVHHGMFWNNESRILDGRVGGRLELLEDYDISLAGYHLALDAHPEIGNNILALKRMGATNPKPFSDIGFGGTFNSPLDLYELRRRAYRAFQRVPTVYPFGTSEIKSIAVIAGGAPQYIVEAQREGYDAFLTGEIAEPTIYLANELNMNFIACGHHATERMGVAALAKKVDERFGTQSIFIDVDNPV